jgi:heme-degrading monooxygenase HmoA
MSGSSSTKRILFFLVFSSVVDILHHSLILEEDRKGYREIVDENHSSYHMDMRTIYVQKSIKCF